jgi:hypothetical protein
MKFSTEEIESAIYPSREQFTTLKFLGEKADPVHTS